MKSRKQKWKWKLNVNDENKNENENVNGEDEDEDDETMSQNEKNEMIKGLCKWSFRWNNWQIKIIWRANKIVKKN